MIRLILNIISHPQSLAAGVVIGAGLGWAGLRYLWAEVLREGQKAIGR